MVVLLRRIERLLPVREGVPERLAARLSDAAACEMKRLVFGLGAFLLSACASTMPSGPSVLALPGTGKSFEGYDGERIQILAIYDPTSTERVLVATLRAEEFEKAP